MDLTFPDRYYKAVEFFDATFGDLESTDRLDNTQKLVFYALRKQVEVGPCNEPAPYMWNVKEKYKHSAWSQLKTMSKFEAMVHFVQHLEELMPQWTAEVVVSAQQSQARSAAGGEKNKSARNVEELLDADVEPTRECVAALQHEVLRLRRILNDNGIDFTMPPPPDIADTSVSAASSSSPLPASQDTGAAATATENTPGDIRVLPPFKPLPLPNSEAASSGTFVVAPPQRRLPSTPSTAASASSNKGKLPEPVYYQPKRLTWLEWLGLISVDEVAEE